jgi:chromosome segregation ATPase
LADKENLTAQLLSQKERLNESGSQLSLLNQQLATLQVENYTLKSQLSSISIQNESDTLSRNSMRHCESCSDTRSKWSSSALI